MAKKQKHKTAKIDTRIPDKVRYGVDLMSRKLGLSVSSYVGRAIEKSLAIDGLATKEPGQLHSLLDRLWSESEAQRLFRLVDHAPELATSHEHKLARVMRECGITEGEEADRFMSEVVTDVFAFNGTEEAEQLMSTHHTMSMHPKLLDKFGSASVFLPWLNKMFAKP